jgi:membrane-associated phospholipid phosphatase
MEMRYRMPFAKGCVLATLCGLCAAPGSCAGDGIETAGDILQLVLPVSAAGLSLGLQDYRGTLQFAESFALTEGVTYGLKYTVNEPRPNGGSHSFPSAHTSVSFSAAEFLRKRYGWEYGIPAYAAASFVAYSRVESQEHYPHDVIAGAGIGILSSYIFTRPYKGWYVKAQGYGKSIELTVSRKW